MLNSFGAKERRSACGLVGVAVRGSGTERTLACAVGRLITIKACVHTQQ